MFDQPIRDALTRARRILLAGCGGGYDLFGAIPFLVELASSDREIHLASLSFTYLNGLDGAIQNRALPNLYEVPAAAATSAAYCPEAWLARWCERTFGQPSSVWCFDKTGVRPLVAAYQYIVERLGIDCIVLIDGGVDALLRGDESSLGTPAEDLVSLAAVQQIAGPAKILACVGLGGEMRDGICHAQVFDRMAELARHDAYLGATALLPQTRAGQLYREAVEFTFENQREQRQSHIHRVIGAAMAGESGSRGPHIWLSPLLSLYWFFALPQVAATHLFLPYLFDTVSIGEVTLRIEGIRKGIQVRDRDTIPI